MTSATSSGNCSAIDIPLIVTASPSAAAVPVTAESTHSVGSCAASIGSTRRFDDVFPSSSVNSTNNSVRTPDQTNFCPPEIERVEPLKKKRAHAMLPLQHKLPVHEPDPNDVKSDDDNLSRDSKEISDDVVSVGAQGSLGAQSMRALCPDIDIAHLHKQLSQHKDDDERRLNWLYDVSQRLRASLHLERNVWHCHSRRTALESVFEQVASIEARLNINPKTVYTPSTLPELEAELSTLQQHFSEGDISGEQDAETVIANMQERIRKLREEHTEVTLT